MSDRRYCVAANRPRIVADRPSLIRTAVAEAARCSIVDPSFGRGSGERGDRPRARWAIVAGNWQRLAARSGVSSAVPLVRHIRCPSTRISQGEPDDYRDVADSDAVAAAAAAAAAAAVAVVAAAVAAAAAPACTPGSFDS